jgi:demethylmenaquinone methyltransferase/2-methoxy-6-polyprenyl-1,4-benzoquinol methylase
MRCWLVVVTVLLDKGYMLPVAQCDAEKLPFPDDWFDVVTVAFGLRNMTHKDLALAEMHRVFFALVAVLLVLEFSTSLETTGACI